MNDKTRGAVLQFEIDRERWKDSAPSFFSENEFTTKNPIDRIYAMAKTAVCDTIHRGGTFVLVASPSKITMIQRPDAEEI